MFVEISISRLIVICSKNGSQEDDIQCAVGLKIKVSSGHLIAL